MSYWLDRLDEIIEQQEKEETPLTLECIPGISLSEFARRDIAVEISSEFLGSNLWLCSNNEMEAQIRQDAPEQVCYTLEEIRSLLSLNPNPDSLKKIHAAKSIFSDSTLKSAPIKDDSSASEVHCDE